MYPYSIHLGLKSAHIGIPLRLKCLLERVHGAFGLGLVETKGWAKLRKHNDTLFATRYAILQEEDNGAKIQKAPKVFHYLGLQV